MKKIAVTVLVLASILIAGAAQAEADQPTIDAIKMLWQNQHKAFDAHDIDGVLATYANSEDIMLMGTGPGEHWVGKEQIKNAYSHFIEGFDAHTMEVQCGESSGSTQGDVLWLTGVCHFTDKLKEQKRQYVLNISAVLIKQADTWRFHTMHFSHLTGSDKDS